MSSTNDLSMLDCAGNERTDGQWTANCYMVHTAGDYKLPLVYGNAIKAGETNAAAYTGVTGNSKATATFPRHDGTTARPSPPRGSRTTASPSPQPNCSGRMLKTW